MFTAWAKVITQLSEENSMTPLGQSGQEMSLPAQLLVTKNIQPAIYLVYVFFRTKIIFMERTRITR
jgi:hypothetical protein